MAALTALAEEIGLMLDEGVVAEAQDIDLCLLLGAGWPFHLGGITPYLDRMGVSERRDRPPFPAQGRGQPSVTSAGTRDPVAGTGDHPAGGA